MDKSLDDIIKAKTNSSGNRGGAVRKQRPGARAAPYQKQRPAAREERSQPAGGTAVHIGNVPYSVDWKALKAHLSSAGDVSRVDIAQRDDGRSLGFATAIFATARAARTAIATLHESELEGRLLVVQEKTSETQGAPSGRGGGRQGGRGGGGRGGSRGGGGGRGGGGIVEDAEEGYTYSGSVGKNGWVKPDPTKFVDKGPPPDPSQNDRGLQR